MPDKHSAKQMHPQPIEEGPSECTAPISFCSPLFFFFLSSPWPSLLPPPFFFWDLPYEWINVSVTGLGLSSKWVQPLLSQIHGLLPLKKKKKNMDDMGKNSFQMHVILKMPGLKKCKKKICALYKLPLLDIWKMRWDRRWGSAWERFTGTGTDSERRGRDLVHTDLQLPSLWNAPGIKPPHDVTTAETFQN